MIITQVKMFSETSLNNLERNVNSFIKTNKGHLFDINIQLGSLSGDEEDPPQYTALVTYRVHEEDTL